MKPIEYPSGELKKIYDALKAEANLETALHNIAVLNEDELRSILYAFVKDNPVQRDSIKLNIVEQLRKYRIEKRMTVKALAEAMNLPANTISSWLNYENLPSDISIDIIIKFLADNNQ